MVEILTLSLNLTDMFNPTVMSLYGKEEQVGVSVGFMRTVTRIGVECRNRY